VNGNYQNTSGKQTHEIRYASFSFVVFSCSLSEKEVYQIPSEMSGKNKCI
jgi:hypothetical protein